MSSDNVYKFLLSPTTATNLIFEVVGLNEDMIATINNMNDSRRKILDRMQAIQSNGGSLKFIKMNNSTFEDNLKLIAPDFPQYLAELIKLYYSEGCNRCRMSVETAEDRDMMKYRDKSLYRESFVCFLEALDSGMRPSKPWGGKVSSQNADYLLQSAKFVRGSTHRERYMNLYREGGKTYIGLNFSIVLRMG